MTYGDAAPWSTNRNQAEVDAHTAALTTEVAQIPHPCTPCTPCTPALWARLTALSMCPHRVRCNTHDIGWWHPKALADTETVARLEEVRARRERARLDGERAAGKVGGYRGWLPTYVWHTYACSELQRM